MRKTFSFSLIALLSLTNYSSAHLLADSTTTEVCVAAAYGCCVSMTGASILAYGVYEIVDGALWPGKNPRPNLPTGFNESTTATKRVCAPMGLSGGCWHESYYSCESLEKKTGRQKKLCVDGCYDTLNTNQQAACKVYKDYFTASAGKWWQTLWGAALTLVGAAALLCPPTLGLVRLCSN